MTQERSQSEVELWRKNLLVCWFTMFVTMVGYSQIAPVLPLFVKHLGVTNIASIERISGIAYGVTYIVSAFFAPLWGYAADKIGRKPMLLRATAGIAVLTFCVGFARSVTALITLRALQGAVTGVGTACTTLIATQSDKDHAGWALGTLSTASMAGALIGPTIGGLIEKLLDLQYVFFITGSICMIAFFISWAFVKEDFEAGSGNKDSVKVMCSKVTSPKITVILFVTYFIVTLALNTIEPIVTVYVSMLTKNSGDVALISGLVFSASGLASIIAAPVLGKATDRIGSQKVLLWGLIIGGLLFIPQAFVRTPWQLMGLRFLFGIATAGLIPAVNAMVKRVTPDEIAGGIFGFLMSAQYFGISGGAFLGGQAAAMFGIRNVFFLTSAVLLLNSILFFRQSRYAEAA